MDRSGFLDAMRGCVGTGQFKVAVDGVSVVLLLPTSTHVVFEFVGKPGLVSTDFNFMSVAADPK